MSAVLAFLAGALVAPEADRAFVNQVLQGYPNWAVRDGQEASFVVEIAALPDGSVADCGLVRSVGNARLAADVCQGMIGKKLKPAISPDGTAAFSLIRTVVTMSISRSPREFQPLVVEPDVELTVNRLPADTDRLDVTVALLVAPDGSVALCEGQSPKGDAPPADGYLDAACAQAKNLRARVIQDSSGQPVQYVTKMQIRFSLDPASPAT